MSYEREQIRETRYPGGICDYEKNYFVEQCQEENGPYGYRELVYKSTEKSYLHRSVRSNSRGSGLLHNREDQIQQQTDVRKSVQSPRRSILKNSKHVTFE